MAVVPKQNSLGILRKLVPLNTLPEESLQRLLEGVVFEKFKRGDYLFHQGDKDPHKVYLLSGRVALIDGRNEVDTVSASSNMARYPLAHQIPRKLSVQAKIKSEAVRIDNRLLDQLLAQLGHSSYEVSEAATGEGNDWMGQLLQSRIFQQIPAANIQSVMMRMKEVEVNEGQEVIRQGEQGDYFYLINEGSCSVSIERSDGSREEVARLGPGSNFGEESLLSGKPRASSVTMLTDGRLLRLGKEDFIKYVKGALAETVGFDEAAFRVKKGALWLDVRSEKEYASNHLPGSINIPLISLRRRFEDLTSDKPYIVYCQDGQLSTSAVYLLIERGLTATVLEGGLSSLSKGQLEAAEESEEGAKILNFRTESGSGFETESQPSPDQEELQALRESLLKAEEQTRAELVRSRKLKQLLDSTKNRLAELEGNQSEEKGLLDEELAEAKKELRSAKRSAKSTEKRVEKLEQQLKEAEKYRTLFKETEQTLQEMSASRDQSEQQLESLESERGRLQAELKASQKELDRLTDEGEKSHVRLETIAEEKRQLQKDLRENQEQLQRQLTELTEERERLQSQLESARSEQETALQELADLTKERQEAEVRLDGLSEEKSGLETELKQLLGELEGVAAEKVQLAEKLQQYEGETEQTKSQLDGISEQNSSLENQLRQLSDDFEALSREKQQLDEQLEQQRAASEEAQQRLEALSGEQGETRESLERLNQEKDALQSELDSLRAESGESRQTLSDEKLKLQEALEAANEELEGLRQQHDNLRGEQVGSEERVEALLADQERLREELEQSREESVSAQQQLDRIRDSQGKTRTALENLTEEKVRLEAELEQARGEGEAARQTLQALNGEQDETRQSIERLDQEKSELEAELEQARGAGESASQALDALRAEQDEARLSIERLDQEKAGLQSELEQVRGERDQIRQRLQAQDDNRAEEALSEENSRLSARVEQLEQENSLVADDLRRTGEQLKSLERQIEEDQKGAGEATDLEQRVETIQQELEQALEARRRQEQRADALRAELEEQNNQQQGRDDRLQQLSEERDRLRRQLGEARTQQQEAERKAASIDQEQQKLQQAFLAADEEVASLKRQLAKQETHDQASDEEARNALEQAQREVEETRGQLGSLKEDYERQLESLRVELSEANQRHQEHSGELNRYRQLVDSLESSGGDELKVLKAELKTLNDALDESDRDHEALLERAQSAERERDRQLQESRQLTKELEELHRIVGDHNGQVAGPEADAAAQQIDALKAELQLVRDRADEDVAQLRQQMDALKASEAGEEVEALRRELEEARETLKANELTGSVEVAENQALKEDMALLRTALDQGREQLVESEKKGQLLNQALEDRNGEVDRLKRALEMSQVDAEEAEFSRVEALQARKQVEEALYELQRQMENSRTRQDLADEGFARPPKALDLETATARPRRGLVAALVGAVIAFAVADGLSVMDGNGEILSNLVRGLLMKEDGNSSKLPLLNMSSADGRLQQAESAREVTAVGSRQSLSKAGSESLGRDRVDQRSRVEPKKLALAKPKPVSRERKTGTQFSDLLSNGSRGPSMVYIRGGRFSMGSDLSQLTSEERPAHDVELRSFAIGRYEVTFQEYEQYVRATNGTLPGDNGWGKGKRPVINLSWQEAKDYAAWLSEQTGARYRLPTEAEWEYVAGAGTDTRFWWGFEPGTANANCFNCGSRWDGSSTAPVGLFSANPFGVYNTAGNVMEWVEDCYHPSYQGAPANGRAWTAPGCKERVVRGGAFNKPDSSMRTTKRSRQDGEARLSTVGFRLVREVN